MAAPKRRVQAIYEPNPVSSQARGAILIGAALTAALGIYLLTRENKKESETPPVFGGTGPEIINTLGPYGV